MFPPCLAVKSGTDVGGRSLTPLRKELQCSASRIPCCDWDPIMTGSGNIEGSIESDVLFTQNFP